MTEPSDLKSAYLICGTDQPKVRRGAARLRKRVYDETGSDLNVSLFDARGQSVADVLQAADTATFTFGTRLLLVSGADTWKAADRDRVAEYLADPVPGVCIALVGETFRKTERLTKLLEKGGQVLRYDLPKRQSDVAEWVRGRARSRGARLGGHEARYLVAQVGADPDTLENELAKLAAYTLGRPIAQPDIDAVCSPTVDARIYQLTDAVGSARRPRRLRRPRGAVRQQRQDLGRSGSFHALLARALHRPALHGDGPAARDAGVRGRRHARHQALHGAEAARAARSL